MNEIINDQRQSYRRGLVLGLTVAEALLLILFGLLLALASIMLRETRKYDAQQKALETAELKLAGFDLVMPKIPLPPGKKPDDFFLELGLMKTENDDLKTENSDMQSKLAEADIVSGIAEAAASSKEQQDALREAAARGELLDEVFGEEFPIEKVGEVLELAKTIEDALPPGDGREDAISDLETLTEQLQKSERQNNDLKGQIANAERRLEQEGQGLKACWATDVGTPDYLFDVALRSDGIQVRNGTRAYRLEDYKSLPIPDALLGRALSEGEFIRLTAPLFQHSEAQNCRFFVKIYDFTGADQKTLYKRRLQIVETHFYKYLVTDPMNWGKGAEAMLPAPTP